MQVYAAISFKIGSCTLYTMDPHIYVQVSARLSMTTAFQIFALHCEQTEITFNAKHTF